MGAGTRRAKVEISVQALVKALGFPPEHRIVHIDPSGENWAENRVTLYVEGPTLPLVPEGQRCPLVEYTTTIDHSPYGRFVS